MRGLSIIVVLLVTVIAVSPALESDSLAKKVATYQCGDGIDNDGDGFTDYPDDPQCIASYDYSEVPQCRDGIDNDGSGAADYPADVDGCQSPEDDTEVDFIVGPCGDGYDNDLDGKTDYPKDPGCRSPFDETETKDPKPPA